MIIRRSPWSTSSGFSLALLLYFTQWTFVDSWVTKVTGYGSVFRTRTSHHPGVTTFSSSSTLLSAKPSSKRQPRQQSRDQDVPANLRRKVDARRPFLGHVVPRDTRHEIQQRGGSNTPQLRRQGQERDFTRSQLRIASGIARGRRLESPDVFLRPMMGKVKEAVFSTLTAFGLYDTTCRHLDVFAGSGNVGLESLSRGATECVFVDLSPDCCACIERNLDVTGLGPGSVVMGDALSVLTNGVEGGKNFHVITICPPYEEVVYGDLLDAVVGSNLVMEDTVLVIEYPIELLGDIPHVVSAGEHTAVGVRNRRYGRTVIAMYLVDPTGKLEAESRPEEFVP